MKIPVPWSRCPSTEQGKVVIFELGIFELGIRAIEKKVTLISLEIETQL